MPMWARRARILAIGVPPRGERPPGRGISQAGGMQASCLAGDASLGMAASAGGDARFRTERTDLLLALSHHVRRGWLQGGGPVASAGSRGDEAGGPMSA